MESNTEIQLDAAHVHGQLLEKTPSSPNLECRYTLKRKRLTEVSYQYLCSDANRVIKEGIDKRT